MSRLNLDVPDPTWIGTDQEASELLRLIMRKVEEDPGDFIGFDTETHALKIPIRGNKKDPLDWMRDTITFWSLSFKVDGKYERYALDQQHFHMFAPLFANPKANIATWNGKYDGHISENSGVDVWECNYMDFQVCGQMLNENVQQGGMDLKRAAVRGFTSEWRRALSSTGKPTDDVVPWDAIPMTKFKDIFGDKDIYGNKAVEYVTSLYDLPLDLVVNYASLDAYATLRLAEHMRDVMIAHDLSEYSGYDNMWEYFTEFEVFMTEILWRMERRGLCVDVQELKDKIEPMQEELDQIQAKINKFAQRPVNLHPSSKDLQELLFGKGKGNLGLKPKKMTKGGATEPKPSTDASVLTEYAAEGIEVCQWIKRFRKVDKIKSTYVDALIFLAEHHEDGRLHPEFKQFGARTGRLSTKVPNSQNFPRPDTDEYQIRRAFIARPGYILIVVDYAQLEMRIMAHFSQDSTMIDAIRKGMDLHCVSVEKMYGIPYEEVYAAKKKSDEFGLESLNEFEKDCLLKRQRCKNTGFAIIYGGGKNRISEMLEIPLEEAQDLLERFFAAYPGIKSWARHNLWLCRKRLYVTTLLGRRRNLPEINSMIWKTKSEAEREANNSVIQGSAADMAKAAMINCERSKRLNRLGVEMVNQIHDELVFECPIQHADEAIPYIEKYTKYPFVDGEDPLDVPTPVDIRKAECWAEAH